MQISHKPYSIKNDQTKNLVDLSLHYACFIMKKEKTLRKSARQEKM